MSEFTVWQDQMADAGLDKRLFAIFEGTLKERTRQMRKAGKNDDPLTEHLDMYIHQATDGQFGDISQKQSSEATNSVLESSTAGPSIQTPFSTSRPSSNDASAAASRAMDLLKGQGSLPIAHQIELWLRLSISLGKTSVLIDPLKALFQLILRKASGIHVFALLAIGSFYEKLGKFQEALEVYTAASRKMSHLDVPLKFRIHSDIGNCYENLGLDMEALRSCERAFSGQEIHLGRGHYETLQSLRKLMLMNTWMSQDAEVLRLSDKICKEQEFVPELDLAHNLKFHDLRYYACLNMSIHDRAAHVKKSLLATLKLCHESYSNDDGITPFLLIEIGDAHDVLREDDMALEYFQLAFEAYKESEGSISATP